VSCTELGVATIGAEQAPAPVPEVFTATLTVEEPSEIVTVAPAVAGEGAARRIVTMDPLTVATTLALLEDTVYVPEPPDTVTWALLEQSSNCTVVGEADNGPGVGQVPVAAPVVLTLTGVLDEPSETVMVAPEVGAEGLTRRTVRTLPEMVALTLPLLEAAL
jgi:hypothetical protein